MFHHRTSVDAASKDKDEDRRLPYMGGPDTQTISRQTEVLICCRQSTTWFTKMPSPVSPASKAYQSYANSASNTIKMVLTLTSKTVNH
ncbi:hypothetical protein ACHAPD_008835 [Fusarium lateritium]